MILIGYHLTSGYKSIDLMCKNIMINRDVVIYKLNEFDWNNSAKKDSVRIMYEESSSEAKTHIQADTNKPQMVRNMPTRLQDCEITLDNMLTMKVRLYIMNLCIY